MSGENYNTMYAAVSAGGPGGTALYGARAAWTDGSWLQWNANGHMDKVVNGVVGTYAPDDDDHAATDWTHGSGRPPR